jgi:hypothetical protein
MVITHHGGQCFKVSFGDITLAFDPPSKVSKLPNKVRFGADVVFVSRYHPDFNGTEEVGSAEKPAFPIMGPGEYEVGGITAHGFLSKSAYGGEGVNTMYTLSLEDMNLCFLGALSDPTLPHDAREALDEIDILFVPVGGDGVLAPSEAGKIATALEPKIVIPMHWSGMGQKDALADFLKEQGDATQTTDKLTIKKKDLIGLDGAIMVINP